MQVELRGPAKGARVPVEQELHLVGTYMAMLLALRIPLSVIPSKITHAAAHGRVATRARAGWVSSAPVQPCDTISVRRQHGRTAHRGIRTTNEEVNGHEQLVMSFPFYSQTEIC